MAEKEDGKHKTLEEEAEERDIKDLYGLFEQAVNWNVVASKHLTDAFNKIPRILEESKRIERTRSDNYSRIFIKKEMEPFLYDFAYGLSQAIQEYRETENHDNYLDIRGEIADYVAIESIWGDNTRPQGKLDFLFESCTKIETKNFGLLGLGYYKGMHKEMIVVITAGLKMFNAVAPKLKSK